MPADSEGDIFPHTVDLNDPKKLADIADKIVCQAKCDGYDLHVYVTGIQLPLVCLINACNKRDVKLVLWHWNPTTLCYYPQDVYHKED